MRPDRNRLEQRIEDNGEGHIAGIVVHAAARHLDAIVSAITALPGATIHAASDEGKLVVTLEADHAKDISARLHAIHALRGVYSAALIYQHHEDIASLNEEIQDAPDAPRIH
jgi:periplasmic nitrate reductase NapD